jgi:hypothetical protein
MQENMRIMTVNCRSIKDKRAEFETTLHYLKPDIICATESWLKGVKPGVNLIKGFKIMQGCFKFCSFIFNTAAVDCHDAHVFLHWCVIWIAA